VIAALFAALFALLATVADQPAPVVQPAPTVQTPPTPEIVAPTRSVAPAPAAWSAPAAPHPSAPETVPACAAGEEWQGEFGCVAVQLPAETDGRQYDPAN
jgi:hypothetical protein